MTLNEWIIRGETGTSSKTMWAAIIGAVRGGNKGFDYDVPHDPDDFRRCLLFVKNCFVSKRQLEMVSIVFPWWKPQIENWDKMAALFEEESPTGRCPKLYDLMQTLEDESMILAGYESAGKGSWKRTIKSAEP